MVFHPCPNVNRYANQNDSLSRSITNWIVLGSLKTHETGTFHKYPQQHNQHNSLGGHNNTNKSGIWDKSTIKQHFSVVDDNLSKESLNTKGWVARLQLHLVLSIYSQKLEII